MDRENYKAALADIRDNARYAADPRETAGRLAGAILAQIEAEEAAAAAPAPAPAPTEAA